MLLSLRNHVIGRETFDAAMREYVRRWAFKHPTPADFFRTVENVAGADLSWFWRELFHTTDVLDIGIDSVVTRTTPGGTIGVVMLTRHTSIPYPVTLRVAYADGRLRISDSRSISGRREERTGHRSPRAGR